MLPESTEAPAAGVWNTTRWSRAGSSIATDWEATWAASPTALSRSGRPFDGRPEHIGDHDLGAPEEMTKVTVSSGLTRVPASGSVLMTIPSGTVVEASSVWAGRSPRSPSCWNAALSSRPARSGSSNSSGPSETTRSMAVPGGCSTPDSGACSMTSPGGGVGVGTRRHRSNGQTGLLDRRLGFLLGHADDVGHQHRFGSGRDVHQDQLVRHSARYRREEWC